MQDWFSESIDGEEESWRGAGMGNVVGAVVRALEVRRSFFRYLDMS